MPIIDCSWIGAFFILYLYRGLKITPVMDCYWVGGSTQVLGMLCPIVENQQVESLDDLSYSLNALNRVV